ncbi:hypothetical protein PIROE2DRAFT_11815 [Piromyces sp. E2]|nr:hypothetical protein PIROE2DRAFT_11815 [Piromyces sp. E2]|eukprot:OUM61999.1 hypothetical protein PIROE2DRAFT_11815 [Piromyces sp. E2]
MFKSYTTYYECALHFSLKYIGKSLSLVILYIYISLGYELGISSLIIEKDEKFNLVNSISIDSLSLFNSEILNIPGMSFSPSPSENSFNKYYNNENVDKLHKNSISNNLYNSNNYNCNENKNYDGKPKNNISINYINDNDNNNKYLNNNIYNSIKSITKYHVAIKNSNNNINEKDTIKNKNKIKNNDKNNENNITQSSSGRWYYTYKLEDIDIIFESVELIILILLLLKGKYIITYDCDVVKNYFKVTKYKKCIVHNSLSCGCKLEESNENLDPIINKYIQMVNSNLYPYPLN